MKRIFYLILTMNLCCCKDVKQHGYGTTKAVSITIDPTDPRTLRCNTAAVLQLFDCVNQPDSEGWLHITTITDKQYNLDYAIHLQPAMVTDRQANDNPMARNSYIRSFYDSVEHVMQRFYKSFDSVKTYNHSEIFATVCRELEWLNKKLAKQKILILLSDLLECSELTNSYVTATKSNVSSLVAMYEATNLLPAALNGFTIYIVNAPKSTAEDTRYSVMVNVYKLLLEGRGAKVIVQQNTQNFTE